MSARFPYGQLLPELQNEVRRRCDWLTLIRLSQTCRAEQVACGALLVPWPGYVRDQYKYLTNNGHGTTPFAWRCRGQAREGLLKAAAVLHQAGWFEMRAPTEVRGPRAEDGFWSDGCFTWKTMGRDTLYVEWCGDDHSGVFALDVWGRDRAGYRGFDFRGALPRPADVPFIHSVLTAAIGADSSDSDS